MPGTEGLTPQQVDRHRILMRWSIDHGPGSIARRILDLEAKVASTDKLLQELDGHLGLAVHRGEGSQPLWKQEAIELISRIRKASQTFASPRH